MKWITKKGEEQARREHPVPPTGRSFYGPPYEDDYIEPLEGSEVRLETRFGPDYIKPLFVIVECYDHKNHGRGKREYLKQFTKDERAVISRYYGRLYDWYLRRGIPVNGVAMRPSTLELLQRAASFFASI